MAAACGCGHARESPAAEPRCRGRARGAGGLARQRPLTAGSEGTPRGPVRRVHGEASYPRADWVAWGSSFGKSKGRPLLQGHGAGPAPGGWQVLPEKQRGGL